MDIQPYPHVDIRVDDQSIFRPLPSEILPLFRPLFITAAEKGRTNMPFWTADLSDARNKLGRKTFEPGSDYYTREAALMRYVYRNSGAFVMRVVPDQDDISAATSSVLILEAHVRDKELDIYVTNEDGERITDNEGNYIPTGETVDGISITWSVRGLKSDETMDDITGVHSVVTAGDDSYESYPMAIFYTDNPGIWGDNTGFSFYYDHAMNDTDQNERLGSVMFTLAPVEKVGDETTAIRDVFNNIRNRFVVKPNTIDPATQAGLSAQEVISEAYDGGRLPYNIKIFHENFETVGGKYIEKAQDYVTWTFDTENSPATYELAADADEGTNELELTDSSGISIGMAVEDIIGIPKGTLVSDILENNVIQISNTVDSTITIGTSLIIDDPTNAQIPVAYDNGYEVNIVGGIDTTTSTSTRRHYLYMSVEQSNDLLIEKLNEPESGLYDLIRTVKGMNYYLQGGDDGEFRPGGMEAKIVAVLNSNLLRPDGTYADLEDASRFPFNHLYDAGYTLETKEEMIAFQSIRGDVLTVLGAYTPDGTNDRLNNIATGRYLRDFANMVLESDEKGTQGCRTVIYAQSGTLVGDVSARVYPATIWDAYVHGMFHNQRVLDEAPQGLPNSMVELFEDWNWIPSAEETKRRMWNDGLNYAQYFSMTGIHYPALRTVYSYETSALISRNFVASICYLKQILRSVWHEFTGVDWPFEIVASRIERRASDKILQMMNNRYEAAVSVYRTEEEANLGYVTHIRVDLTAGGTNRVHVVDIVVNRD